MTTTAPDRDPIPTWREDGRALGSLPGPTGEVLLYGALERGLGSSRLPLDRGLPTDVLLLRWRREEDHVVIVAVPTALGAGAAQTSRAQELAVEESFTVRTLARARILREDDRRPGRLVVDLGDLLLADVQGYAALLGSAAWGGRERSGYRLDHELSTVLESSGAGSLRADLVLRREGTAPSAAPGSRVHGAGAGIEPQSESWLPSEVVRLRLQLWLEPVPGPGFTARPHHPRSGAGPRRHLASGDVRTPEQALHPRFRAGEAVEILVDPGIPQPYLDAVVDGTRWWSVPFAQQGIPLEVRVAQPGETLWGARRHVVLWVHRAGRGWSLGGAQTVPLTGEILRSSVRLGSERILQLRQLFESLLSPFGAPDEAERLAAIEDALLARIRLLAAHEVGHALGFSHNFSTHADDVPSVLDYPFPDIRADAEGHPVLDAASYQDGLGSWDRVLVDRAYADRSGADPERRSHLTEADAADAVASAPWVLRRSADAADALSGLVRILAIRERALAGFGAASAPPDAQQGELRARFSRLHLLHRFHADEVAGLVGGADYGYGTVEDLAAQPVRAVPAALQREALDALAALLSPRIIGVPDAALRWLAPAADRYGPGESEAPSLLGRLPDPVALSGAAAALVLTTVLSGARLNRLSIQHRREPELPGISEVVARLVQAAAEEPPQAGGAAAPTVLAGVVQVLAGDDLHAGTRDELEELLAHWPDEARRPQARRARRLLRRDPSAAALRHPLPVIPPGAPL